jgi:hypothetical protein
MKVQAFKKIIKEAVAEAVREELQEIFSQKTVPSPLREMKTISFDSNDLTGVADIRAQLHNKMGNMFGMQPQYNDLKVIDAVDESTGEKINPFAAFIQDADNNMSAQDRSGLRQLD